VETHREAEGHRKILRDRDMDQENIIEETNDKQKQRNKGREGERKKGGKEGRK
jgi:hypothetical protein